MHVHSIPSNNDNQDIVSMGSNAALLCARVIENSFEVLAVQGYALVEAIDYLNKQDLISVAPKKLYSGIRSQAPKIMEDRPVFTALRGIKQFLRTEKI
jgi:histidine ammonia-lyase